MNKIAFTDSERRSMLKLLALAKEEDLGTGDITCKLLPGDLKATGIFAAREPLVVCGGCFLRDIAREYSELIEVENYKQEGELAQAGEPIARWSGPAWAVMSAERIALNFLQRLSGIATLTKQFVDKIAGTGAKIYDTRKTTPGWRYLEKYAVRAGGGFNHRKGLFDAIIVKDNHLVALTKAGRPTALADMGPELDNLRKHLPHDGFIEIEVDTLEQFADALTLPADIVMLDNIGPDGLRKAIQMRKDSNLDDKIVLEASGGITLNTIRPYAETGIDRIALGCLTHSAVAVDIGLDLTLGD